MRSIFRKWKGRTLPPSKWYVRFVVRPIEHAGCLKILFLSPGAANSTIFETADLDRQYFYWRGLRIQPLVAFNMAGMADQTCFFKVQLGQSAGRTRAIGFSWKIPFPPLLLTSEIQKYRNRDHKFKFRSFLLVFGLSSFSFYSLAENCISGNNGCRRIFFLGRFFSLLPRKIILNPETF